MVISLCFTMSTEKRFPNINTGSRITIDQAINFSYPNIPSAINTLRQVIAKCGSTYYVKTNQGMSQDVYCTFARFAITVAGQKQSIQEIVNRYEKLFEYPYGTTLKDPETMTAKESENYISFYFEYKGLNPYEKWTIDHYYEIVSGFTMDDIAKDFPGVNHICIGKGLTARFCNSERKTSKQANEMFSSTGRTFRPGQKFQVYTLRRRDEIPLYYTLVDIKRNDEFDADIGEFQDDEFYEDVYGLKE